MGLLSGLSNMGLGKLEESKLYGEEEKETRVEEKKEEVKSVEVKEEDLLFDKKCECPVCAANFTYRTIRTGKLKLVGTDSDLRPRYDKLDPAKYDAIVCPKCGYGVLTRFLQPLSSAQIKLIKENIAGKVHGIPDKPVLDYDDAIQRYQLVLASSIVKRAKDSEKAYVCLKLAWLIRGKKESLSLDDDNYDEMIRTLNNDENEALKEAFDGFVSARSKETFPMAGMDVQTVDYLLAVLSARFGHFDIAQKLISDILLSKSANNRVKDKARELKEQILIDMKMARNEM